MMATIASFIAAVLAAWLLLGAGNLAQAQAPAPAPAMVPIAPVTPTAGIVAPAPNEYRLGAGDVTRLTFTSERIEVVAVSSGGHVLGVALTRGQDTRSAQQTLARLALDLTNLPRTEG